MILCKSVGYQKLEVKRVIFLRIPGGYQAVCYSRGASLHAFEFAVPGKTVGAHGIFISFIMIDSAVQLAHEGEENRRVPSPVLRIRVPQNLPLLLLIIHAGKLSPRVIHFYYKICILQCPHFCHLDTSCPAMPPVLLLYPPPLFATEYTFTSCAIISYPSDMPLRFGCHPAGYNVWRHYIISCLPFPILTVDFRFC